MNGLDDGLRTLAAEEPSTSLEDLEGDVWRKVGRKGPAPRAAAIAASTSLALALGVGAIVGRASAVSQPSAEVAVFDVNASLAPSSLLGVR